MLRDTVLLKDEPLTQSEVKSTLERVFSKAVSVLCCIFPSILTIVPVPAAEKHLHSMMPPPRFIAGMVLAWFPPNMTLGIHNIELYFRLIRPKNSLSPSLKVLHRL